MSADEPKLIGLLIGRENDLPDAVTTIINDGPDEIRAEMIKLGGTFQDSPISYDVIIDRMSHEIPYYRSYVKYACLHGTYLINNPFTWSADTKFFASAVVHKLGLKAPRTMVLPNKDVDTDTVPDSFRNLDYPMDWQGIIDYIGSPAIFKDVRSGGRRFAHRVSNVDELIQRYDESGTRTMILQQVLETDHHIHCMVIGQDKTMLMPYSFDDKTYLEGGLNISDSEQEEIRAAALALTKLYDYDFNLPEFVVKDGTVYIINATNPSPLVDRDLMTGEQFDWTVEAVADLAIKRARKPLPQPITIVLPD